MSADSCQLLYVSLFMSADSCQLIHASWLRSVEFRLAGYISCLDQLDQIIWIYQLLRSAESEYMDISAGSVCVNKAAVSISCSCLADSVYSAVSVQIVQNSNSDQVILWWVSIALCKLVNVTLTIMCQM